MVTIDAHKMMSHDVQILDDKEEDRSNPFKQLMQPTKAIWRWEMQSDKP